MLTTQELINNANSRQPDNSNGEISAADVREQNKDVAVSSFNKVSDKHLIGLRNYDPSRSYEVGEAVTYDNGGGEILWRCTEATTGAFNPSKWVEVGSGATSYSLSVDPSKTNGLEVLGTNPQTVGIAVAAAGQSGALSATDWAEFKAKQAALGFTPLNAVEKGLPFGIAPLDSSGVVAFANLPSSLAGALDYKGTYDASTNTPAITDAGGAIRQYYVVSTPGTQDFGSGSISLGSGDFLIHDGAKFDHVSTQGAGIESVQGDTSTNIDLGSGTENKLVAWKPGNKFKEVDIEMVESGGAQSFGVGGSAFSGIDLSIGGEPTGFTTLNNSITNDLYLIVGNSLFATLGNPKTTGYPSVRFQHCLKVVGSNSSTEPNIETGESSSNHAAIRVNYGAAPTNPQPGDVWATSDGLFYRYGTQTINLSTPNEGVVQTIVGGSNVAVNNSDPQNPVVSAFPTTTAGLLSRTYFTADTETLSAGTFFKSNRDGKGVAETATQTVTVNDNEKEFFAQDLISEPYPIETTIYAGSYSGILNGKVSAASAEQKFYVEIYLTDANGTPVSSGITGAPVGDLGVEVVAIAESGLIDLRQSDETQFAITAELTGNLTLSTSNRIRYHVAAEKSGAAGGAIDISISYGSGHVAHLDIPIPSTTNTVINTDAATFPNEATQYDINRKLNTDKIGSTTAGEPTGATVIGNIVEISQTDYDSAKTAGTLNATTLYLTPDA